MLLSNVINHVILVFIILLLIMAARRLRIAYPIVLAIGGAYTRFLPKCISTMIEGM